MGPRPHKAALALLAIAVGCGEGPLSEEQCIARGNHRPAPPRVVDNSFAGGLSPIVVPAELAITLSPFRDEDADGHGSTELEIWRLAGRNGAPVYRVWTANLEGPAPVTRVALADGAFEGLAAGRGLLPWEHYAIRARTVDDNSECTLASDWSADAAFRTDDGSATWFESDRIHTVKLTIPQSSLDAIDAEAVPPGCVPFSREYHPGTLEFEGEVFENVGIRSKGGCGSARSLDEKAALKVHLAPTLDATCPDSRRLHGLKRLTFNNMVQDPSFVRETLAYSFYRQMGVPAPRVAHINLEVNGELWGLYLQQESFDRRFLDRWFESDDGMLYEGTYSCDLEDSNAADDDSGCIQRKFKPDSCKTPGAGADPQTYEPYRTLAAAIDALPDGGFYPAIADIMEFDTFLSSWAVATIIENWDSYEFLTQNNYRIYHNPASDRWTVIPSGLDQTFIGALPELSVEPQGLLAARCLAEPGCTAAYLARVREALAVFESAGFSDIAGRARARIADLVAADPRKPESTDRFNESVDETIAWITGRAAAVRQALSEQQ